MCIKNKEATWVVCWDKVKKTVNFLESKGGIYLASDDEASLIGHMYGFGLENPAEEYESKQVYTVTVSESQSCLR